MTDVSQCWNLLRGKTQMEVALKWVEKGERNAAKKAEAQSASPEGPPEFGRSCNSVSEVGTVPDPGLCFQMFLPLLPVLGIKKCFNYRVTPQISLFINERAGRNCSDINEITVMI